jgi:prepilin-type N-terminal cleavage/methylation domain-containing protein
MNPPSMSWIPLLMKTIHDHRMRAGGPQVLGQRRPCRPGDLTRRFGDFRGSSHETPMIAAAGIIADRVDLTVRRSGGLSSHPVAELGGPVHRQTGRPAPPSAAWRPTKAFTLLELMLVISVMGMLAALMIPAVKGMRKMNDMTVACRQLQDDLGLARQRAISERTTVYVVFVPPTIANPNVMAALRAEPDRRALAMYTNYLAKGQYTTYALYSERRLGAQPGQFYPHYITEWKMLPEGVFIATNKFTVLGNVSYRSAQAVVRPFLSLPTRRFPFPLESVTAAAYQPLPYIAFNPEGRLEYPKDWQPARERDEVIPLARGSIFTLKDAQGYYLPADAQEVPRGNSISVYNRIRVNWLTGRARVERPEIQ